MGELSLTNSTAYVFLDVPTGVHLSPAYWAAWANAVQLAPTENYQFPFQPCVCCDFSSGIPHQPDLVVEEALNKAKTAWDVGQVRCYGYWAKVLIQPPPPGPNPTLDWGEFGAYTQNLQLGTQSVPVLLWRYAVPDKTDAATDGFGLLTMDAADEDQTDPCVSDQMLEVGKWDPKSADATSMGFDIRSPLTASVTECVKGEQLHIYEWPKNTSSDPTHSVNWNMKPSYVCRYYSDRTSAKVLTRAEAVMLRRANLSVTSVFAPTVRYGISPRATASPQPNMYTWLQQKQPPDDHGQGVDDAQTAFLYAANVIRQPAYTPVYFDVDFNLGDPDDQFANIDPTLHDDDVAVLRSYFVDIAFGYQNYLTAQNFHKRPETPYLIGVYGSGEVLSYCYKQGIATYYWEACAPAWTGTKGPWVHVNNWQVANPSRIDPGRREYLTAVNGPRTNCPAEENVLGGPEVTYVHNGLTDSSKSWLPGQWLGNTVLSATSPPVGGTVEKSHATSLTFKNDWMDQSGNPAPTPPNSTGYVIVILPDVDVSFGDEGSWTPSK